MRNVFFFAVVAACFCLPAFSQNFSCPAGTEDVLNYVVMGYPNRADHYMGPGNANPIYSYISPEDGSSFAANGYLLWIKDPSGAPWDVKAFDSNYVYDRTTELTWNDPTSFRRWNTDLPMFHRCVPMGHAAPDIRVPASNTNYTFYQSCTQTQMMNLGYVLNSLSPPVQVNTRGIGNIGTVSARLFRYRYGCDSSYNNCTDMEVYTLGNGVGLIDWKHYVNRNGSFVLVQDANMENFRVGATTPNTPCPNSYQ